MPVEKYRSGEEMNARPIVFRDGDPFTRFLRVCQRYRMLSPRRYPRGVFRFRTLDEAQAARERVANATPPGATTDAPESR
jgi:hypothetical protein